MHARLQLHLAPAREHGSAGHRRRRPPSRPAPSTGLAGTGVATAGLAGTGVATAGLAGTGVAQEARDALVARGIEVLSTAWDEQAAHLRVEVVDAASARIAAQDTADEAAARIRPDARVDVTVVPAALAFA